VHALGERLLKDIDEPERVYELAIEGVEQPEPAAQTPVAAKSKEEWDRRAEDLSTRLSEKINESVLRSLERSLGLDKRK
jgi:hypothetical protein